MLAASNPLKTLRTLVYIVLATFYERLFLSRKVILMWIYIVWGGLYGTLALFSRFLIAYLEYCREIQQPRHDYILLFCMTLQHLTHTSEYIGLKFCKRSLTEILYGAEVQHLNIN